MTHFPPSPFWQKGVTTVRGQGPLRFHEMSPLRGGPAEAKK